MKELFHRLSARVSIAAGNPFAFFLAFGIVAVWAITGPVFNFSNTWQLFINTGTTIVTFLMIFLVQNTQNRDGKAMQLKLDELIRSSKSARDSFVGLEDISDEELAALDMDFRKLHEAKVTSPEMHKLHTKVLAEHARRTGREMGRDFAIHTKERVVKTFLGKKS